MAITPIDPKTSSLGDRLWIDTNGNGIQDGSEIGLDGVTVQLLDVTGKVLATTTSAPDGTQSNYLFTGLAAGQYQIHVTAPTGYAVTGQDQLLGFWSEDNIDSDISTTAGNYLFDNLEAGKYKVTYAVGTSATSVTSKLASLLQPADDLLHQAFGHATTDTAAAHSYATDGGDSLRQMLALWSQHHSA